MRPFRILRTGAYPRNIAAPTETKTTATISVQIESDLETDELGGRIDAVGQLKLIQMVDLRL